MVFNLAEWWGLMQIKTEQMQEYFVALFFSPVKYKKQPAL